MAAATSDPLPGVRIKICGLTTAEGISAAVEAGADEIGLVFFSGSPRSVSLADAGRLLDGLPDSVTSVALTVDADDALIDAITGAGIGMHQLHGRETPERVVAVRARSGRPVMKAIGIAEPLDLEAIPPFAAAADRLLLDAKPPAGASRPGGNAVSFDWRLIAGRHVGRPWMLAGGLTPANVGEAIRLTGARAVDVSSGVESRPGQKDPGLIRAFVEAVRAA